MAIGKKTVKRGGASGAPIAAHKVLRSLEAAYTKKTADLDGIAELLGIDPNGEDVANEIRRCIIKLKKG